jgi:integrase
LEHFRGYRDRFTVHGMRAAFGTWAEEHGYGIPLIDVALAHQKKSRTQKAYMRSDHLKVQRELMARMGCIRVQRLALTTSLRRR